MTTPVPPSPSSNAFLGWLLVAFGGLMVLLCGGCTLSFWAVGVYGVVSEPGPASLGSALLMVVYTTLIGGLPTAGGAVLVWAGLRMIRPRPPT